MTVNKAIIIGRLGQDPELRYLPNGDAVCNISVATSEKWKDKNSGEQKEATEWHRVTLFRRLAEVVAEYLRKGSLIYIEGSIHTRKWQGEDGQDRYITEIRADEMKMLGGKGDRSEGDGGEPRSKAPASGAGAPSSSPEFIDDDIPFASCNVADDPIYRRTRRKHRL